MVLKYSSVQTSLSRKGAIANTCSNSPSVSTNSYVSLLILNNFVFSSLNEIVITSNLPIKEWVKLSVELRLTTPTLSSREAILNLDFSARSFETETYFDSKVDQGTFFFGMYFLCTFFTD